MQEKKNKNKNPFFSPRHGKEKFCQITAHLTNFKCSTQGLTGLVFLMGIYPGDERPHHTQRPMLETANIKFTYFAIYFQTYIYKSIYVHTQRH